MPTTIGEAFVAIRPDVDGFAAQAEAGVKPGLSKIAGLIAGTFAAAKVKDFFADSFSEAQEAQKVGAQTEQVIKSQGNAAGVTAKQVGELSGALSRKAGIDDEVIQSGANMLLTFSRVRNEAGKGNDIFNQATKATLDMAVAFSKANGGEIDLQGASIQLGKALNDPIQGVTALQKVGVRLTDQQKEQVKAFVESGDTLSAQKVILGEVTKEFGGSAEAQATAADKAKVAWGNLQESIGTALLPVLNSLLEVAAPIADFLSEHQEAAAALAIVVGGVLTAAFYKWAAALVTSTKAGLSQLFTELANGAKGLVSVLGAVVEGFKSLVVLVATNPILAATAVVIGAATAIAIALGSETDEWKRSEEAGRSWAKTIAAGANATTAPLASMRAALDQVEASIREHLKAGDLSMEQAAKLKGMQEGLVGQIAATKQAHKEAAAAEQARTTQLGQLANGILDVGKASDDTKSAIENMQNAVLAATGGEIGYRAALATREQAIRDLQGAIFIYGEGSDEAAAAQLRLDQAQQGVAAAALSQTDATNKLKDEIANTEGGANALIAKLEEEKRVHGDASGAIDIQIQKIKDLGWEAAVLDSVHANPHIGLDTSGFDAAIGPLLFEIGLIGDALVRASVGSDVASAIAGGLGFASGGRPPVGVASWVGENGPELFIPDRSGLVVPHNASMAMAGAAGGSPGGLFAGATVQFYDNPIPQLDYYAITRAGN